jgi:hypothetical protein
MELAEGSFEVLAMVYLRRLLVGAIGALTLVGGGTVGVGASESTLIEFNSMTGVAASGVKVTNDRGITAGGAPWVITSATGHVDRQGNVSVRVTGLIIPILNPPHNPVGSFRATVSCLTPDGPMNVTTDPSTLTNPTGDATIVGKVALPHPCKDPIVFVVNGNPSTPGGHDFAWFAMSNAEDGD